jgi:hypothetical protein
MQPNIQDILLEWTFSPQEAHIAAQLDEIKLRWIATKYAKLFKKKAALEMPITPDEQRSYFLELARIDGRLDVYQELLDEHKVATNEINAAKAAAERAAKDRDSDLATRASQQVHKT